jgi:hypothetical protein
VGSILEHRLKSLSNTEVAPKHPFRGSYQTSTFSSSSSEQDINLSCTYPEIYFTLFRGDWSRVYTRPFWRDVWSTIHQDIFPKKDYLLLYQANSDQTLYLSQGKNLSGSKVKHGLNLKIFDREKRVDHVSGRTNLSLR